MLSPGWRKCVAQSSNFCRSIACRPVSLSPRWLQRERRHGTGDYMTGRGTVNIARRQLGDALFWRTVWLLGDPLFDGIQRIQRQACSSCSVFTDFAACSTPPPPHSRSRIDAHTLAGPQRVFAFPQDVVSQASKASPEMSNYRRGLRKARPSVLTSHILLCTPPARREVSRHVMTAWKRVDLQ